MASEQLRKPMPVRSDPPRPNGQEDHGDIEGLAHVLRLAKTVGDRGINLPLDPDRQGKRDFASTLDLVRRAATFIRETEKTARQNETRAQELAAQASADINKAEAFVRSAEAQVRAADARTQASEARAREAETKAKEAETKAKEAETRAKEAEIWLARVFDTLEEEFNVLHQGQPSA
jgi:flagellar biosynthesis GTPase FlhF